LSEATPESLPPGEKTRPEGRTDDTLFPLGQVVATPGALRALEKADNKRPMSFLDRHVNGDWGDVPEVDKQRACGYQSSKGFASCQRIRPAPVIGFGADRSGSLGNDHPVNQRNIDRKG